MNSNCRSAITETHTTNQETVAEVKFSPGAIHERNKRSFWKEELKTGEWVMGVLKNGQVIPFGQVPPPYEEENNASAKRQMQFVRETVYELKEAGVIEFTKLKPEYVSPLTVAEKTMPDGSKKLRICWDGSRCVNLALKKAESHAVTSPKGTGDNKGG